MNNFKTKYRVSWVDTDALGIMHFSNYFRACEKVEEEFTNSLGVSFSSSKNISFPRVKATCDFKYPLRFNDIAVIELKIKELGKKHITYHFDIFNETQQKEAARCELTIASINNEFVPIPIPEEYIKLLEKYKI
ncbi:MAG: thioesterase family protein [Thermoplasmata archaeon]